MPYAPCERSTSITVSRYEVTLEPLPRWVKAGEKVTFTGVLTRNGAPVKGEYVDIYMDGKTRIRTGRTGRNGVFKAAWTAGFKYACSDHTFKAVHRRTGAESPEQRMAIAYPTRVTISAPREVQVGKPFTVTGRLQYEYASGRWRALAGRTVAIYYDGNLLGHAKTDEKGNYSLEVAINTPGNFTLKAVFAGEALPMGAMAYTPTSAAVTVEAVGMPKEVPKAPQIPLGKVALAVGLATSCVALACMAARRR